jgi:16S rRNA (uracil1498-N3)-methyltransferase
MRRYWLEKEAFRGDLNNPSAMIGTDVLIEDDSLHHIRDVCRQTVGDHFEVLIDGSAFLVEVVGEKKRELKAMIREVRQIEALPTPRLRVALAIPRFNVLESVLEKLVEMGVETVQPLFSDNSFIRTATDTWEAKEPRFQKIIQSATQQCGRGEKMRLAPARRLNDFLSELTAEINQNGRVAGLFAYEIGTSPVRDLVASISKKEPEAVWVFVGGEGGFSQAEVKTFEASGFKSATLGRQVLRVETACVALVSILKYELDLMR